MEDKRLKIKRKRQNPVKRWNDREVSLILSYVQTVGNFEKPTAQIYYKKLLEKTQIKATWDLVRCKVRNLRMSFAKANEWRKSTEASRLDCEEGPGSVEERCFKMCPFYEKIKEIFDDKKSDENSFTTYKLADFIKYEEPSYSDLNNCTSSISEAQFQISRIHSAFEETNDNDNDNSTTGTTQISETPIETPKLKNPSSVSVDEHLNESEKSPSTTTTASAIHKFEQIKLEFEKEKFSSGLEIEEQKLNLEKDKLYKDYELQSRRLEFEIEKFRCEQEMRKQEFELKKLQMEKEERIAMFEIEMKYKNKTCVENQKSDVINLY